MKVKELTRAEKIALILGKDILTLEEAVHFIGLSKSTIYKKTASNQIPHYKQSRHIYFKKSELEDWMLSNKVKTIEEIEASASTFVHLQTSKAC